MGFLNTIVIIVIAICYNLFIHYIPNVIFSGMPFDDKYNKTLYFIFVAGLVGIVISKLLVKEGQEYKKSVVSMGLSVGGFLLLITALITNWENMGDGIKLLISGGLFLAIVYYGYNYYDNKDNKKVS